MHTDPRARSSIPLAYDHFRDGPKKAPAAKRAAPKPAGDKPARPVKRREDAPAAGPAVERPATREAEAPAAEPMAERSGPPASVRVAKAARRAASVAGAAARHTVRAIRWSGEKSFQFVSDVAHRLRTPPRAATPDEQAAEHQSRYAALPNRLTALAALSESQYVQARASLPNRRMHQAGSVLLAEGEQQPDPSFVLSGWACRSRLHEGKLHVLGLLLPGDGIGLFGPDCTVSSTRVTAITTLETADGQMMLDLVQDADDDSALRIAMHRVMAEEEALLLNHIMRMTMKSPVARLSHFLLELRYRLVRTGLATASDMPLPLDRHTIASALGLSPAAVGRAVRTLEMQRIARFGHGRVRILRDDTLQKLGCFTPPAFSDGSGRKLINDVDADDTFNLPPAWIQTAPPAQPPQEAYVETPPQKVYAEHQRPASA